MTVFTVVDILSYLVLFGDILIVLFLGALTYEAITKRKTRLMIFVSERSLLLMLIVAIVASCGSLFLSEIAGWAPCKDCWLQRIFMYPQAVLLAIALWKKDKKIAVYILALSLIGAVLSVHHYYEQIEATFFAPPTDSLEPCDATGVSCAKTYTFRFGYVTIPMMALTGFILNSIGSWTLLRKRS